LIPAGLSAPMHYSPADVTGTTARQISRKRVDTIDGASYVHDEMQMEKEKCDDVD